ncbi:MAG: hypothetical protein N0E58_19440 [Candidatus Thiodiazotropha endolucinida]|uniref:Uncharacterized protein n=1 Tax=Candidatus Thiodiazotropha taylori TaxID=2792791 RepID=A0A9E4TUF6_9GAMM|nr:hypothetical protein [Candidatus Thiodiazotropha taylori]MCW4238425.1 hypothetical protein [Candidatus Thiodiazotropha endolucinida]
MKQAHMNKATTIFRKVAEKMIDAGVDPSDVSAALVGLGTAISVHSDGVESTGDWLKEISKNLNPDKPSVPIN